MIQGGLHPAAPAAMRHGRCADLQSEALEFEPVDLIFAVLLGVGDVHEGREAVCAGPKY